MTTSDQAPVESLVDAAVRELRVFLGKPAGRDALAGAGVACVLGAVALWSPLLGLLLLGLSLIGLAYLAAYLTPAETPPATPPSTQEEDVDGDG